MERKTSRSMVRVLMWAALILLFSGTLTLSPGESGNEGPPEARASFKPGIVYVADFGLDAAATDKGDKGRHGRLQLRKRVQDMVDPDDPEQKAKQIVDTLATAIVKELTDKKVIAKRLGSGGEPSSESWLLEGVFVEYGDGDRLKRAVIGFGSGSATMTVMVKLSEVKDGGMRTLFDSRMDPGKNRMPGAVVTKNPYMAAAKYVTTKNAPEREVKKLGSEVADKLYDYMKTQGFVSAP